VIERDLLYLAHVAAAIEAIRSFTAEGRAFFMADPKTQSAVVRQFEIVGEAVKRLSDATKRTEPDVPWRAIAGTRDRLIHAYFQVDLASVWMMVERDLDPLKAAIDRLRMLRAPDPGGDQVAK
jgi:uncharacterized protein with HEPN domain